MSKQRRNPTKPPRTPSEALEELCARYGIPDIESPKATYLPYQATTNAPTDGDSGYWDDANLRESLEPQWDRTYGPDEQLELLGDFTVHVERILFIDEWVRVWASLPVDVNNDKLEPNSRLDLAIRERRWLSKVFPQIERLAETHGHGEQPLNWLDLYISGIENTLEKREKRQIRASLVWLYKAELRKRDPGAKQNNLSSTKAGRRKNKSGTQGRKPKGRRGRKSTVDRDEKLAEDYKKFDGTWKEFANKHNMKESAARAAVKRGNKAPKNAIK